MDQRTPRQIAFRMMDEESPERRESEKMMGKSFDAMTPEERRIAATFLSAFDGVWQERKLFWPYFGPTL